MYKRIYNQETRFPSLPRTKIKPNFAWIFVSLYFLFALCPLMVPLRKKGAIIKLTDQAATSLYLNTPSLSKSMHSSFSIKWSLICCTFFFLEEPGCQGARVGSSLPPVCFKKLENPGKNSPIPASNAWKAARLVPYHGSEPNDHSTLVILSLATSAMRALFQILTL